MTEVTIAPNAAEPLVGDTLSNAPLTGLTPGAGARRTGPDAKQSSQGVFKSMPWNLCLALAQVAEAIRTTCTKGAHHAQDDLKLTSRSADSPMAY